MPEHLPALALLDVLRPPVGWLVDRALLSTYSAEPSVLAAVLLALVARDEDNGSGARSALARALIELRGRVAIVVQRGRVAAPGAGSMAIGLLDRYVREAPYAEGAVEGVEGRSWHAKAAIVRFRSEADQQVCWRFWLGSRNLTRDLSWDIGLSIEGRPGGRGHVVPGVDEVARRLAEAAGESAAWRDLAGEIAGVRWETPSGLRVERIHLHLPDDRGRSMPPAPRGLTGLFAVAPFLDGQTVSRLGAWGDPNTERSLLSTRQAMASIAGQAGRPLLGFAGRLLVLPAPLDHDDSHSESESSEADTDSRGLHAKFLWAEHPRGATFVLGSPNLTRRGWTRNAEIVAEVAADLRTDAGIALREGVHLFRDRAEQVAEADLGIPVGDDPELERLDRARSQVAARFVARQRRQPDRSVRVESAAPPHPDDPEVLLTLRRLGGHAAPWPREQTWSALPPVEEGAESDLLVLSVALGEREQSWTQMAPFDPPFGARRDDRDAAALGAWLGARGVLAAVGELLSGDGGGDAGVAWDAPDEQAHHGRRGAAAWDKAPSVEMALRVWQRDQDRLSMVDNLLKFTPPSGAAVEPQEAEARERLDAFRRSWTVIRRELRTPRHAD